MSSEQNFEELFWLICIFGHTTSFWDWDHDVLHLPYLPGIFSSGISDPGDFSLTSLCRSDACPAAEEEGDPSLDRSNWKVRHGQISNGFICIFDHSRCETAVQWYFEQNKFLKLAWYIALHRSLQRSRDFMLAEDGSSICFSLVSVVKSTRQLKRIQKASASLYDGSVHSALGRLIDKPPHLPDPLKNYFSSTVPRPRLSDLYDSFRSHQPCFAHKYII